MNRRDILRSTAAALAVGLFSVPARAANGRISYFGALEPDRVARHRMMSRPKRSFYDRFSTFRNVSRDAGNVLLYQYLQKEIGEIVPHRQMYPDGRAGEGDCGAQAGSLGCDVLAAVNIHMLGRNEKFVGKTSTEMLYAYSRNEIGGGVLKGSGGSRGIWIAEAAKHGILHRIKYERDGNSIDLSGYDVDRSIKYRDLGMPDWLEPIAKEHPVREFTQVNSGREALDAVAAGQVVLLSSSYAFGDRRDDQGFTAPLLGGQRRTKWGRFLVPNSRPEWWHCMLLAGRVNFNGREGGTVLNSAGVWNQGPQPNDLPDGGFNVEIQYLDMMVKDWGDCYALSSYDGHEAALIKHKLY